MQCAYLRAALAEFSSIEDIISQSVQKNEELLLIRNSNNPAFHFLKLLRNYNVHLSESVLEEKNIQVTFAGTEHDLAVLYIDNLEVNEILKLYSAKYYSKAEIDKFIELFEEKQHRFGVGNLLVTIIIQYSKYISSLLISDHVSAIKE